MTPTLARDLGQGPQSGPLWREGDISLTWPVPTGGMEEPHPCWSQKHTHRHTSIHVCAQTHTLTQTHSQAPMHTHTQKHPDMCVQRYIHIYSREHTQAYTNVLTHTYRHTCTHLLKDSGDVFINCTLPALSRSVSYFPDWLRLPKGLLEQPGL